MFSVTVYDNTTREFYFWVLGFQKLAQRGEIELQFARGRHSPMPHGIGGWGFLTFTVEGGGLARAATTQRPSGSE